MRIWHESVAAVSAAVLVFDAADVGEPNLGYILENRLLQRALLQAFTAAGGQLIPAALESLAISEDGGAPAHGGRGAGGAPRGGGGWGALGGARGRRPQRRERCVRAAGDHRQRRHRRAAPAHRLAALHEGRDAGVPAARRRHELDRLVGRCRARARAPQRHRCRVRARARPGLGPRPGGHPARQRTPLLRAAATRRPALRRPARRAASGMRRTSCTRSPARG